jgi:hypothetical protein
MDKEWLKNIRTTSTPIYLCSSVAKRLLHAQKPGCAPGMVMAGKKFTPGTTSGNFKLTFRGKNC